MISGDRYSVSYDPVDQQMIFKGELRTIDDEKLKDLNEYLTGTYNKVEGTMKLNFRKLRYINSAGLKILIKFLKNSNQNKKLKIKLIGSNVITWEGKTLMPLSRMWDNVEFIIHDKKFYKSQGIIEDSEFIPLLRNQTRLLWPIEKEILKKHGLKEGMKVADICCGCGDIALLIAREFRSSIVTGIDHSEPAIEYALSSQREYNVLNADFRLGDATALMLDDELFDFVLCRLSIQIFSKPKEILKELLRITKQNGRIYLLGEDYDMIVGYPNTHSIRNVYDKAGAYGTKMGMDLYNGKKLYSILKNLRLKDTRIDYIIVDTNNSDRNLFAEMIKSWRYFSVETIGNQLKLKKEEHEELLAGYDDHIKTINDPLGYTTWTIVAGSGTKIK